MKLNIKSPQSQSNQDFSNTKRAKISDIKVIVDLLRRHYAFPIRTLVQEYLCNARDAHREINQTRPIEVTLPTKSQPVLKIRDFGSSMDAQRLEENFLNYGGSTKNQDNNQTGGFGIGSKSAWVYTPTFYIKVFKNSQETTFEASIAVHYEGALKEISVKKSKEEDGVGILIPIQIKDIKEFINAFYRATYFWKEEVKVVNFSKEELNEEWVNKNYLRTGKMFFIGENPRCDFFDEIGIEDVSETVVVDGIPYGITSNLSYERHLNYSSGVMLDFNTGELSVSISREAIEDVEINRKRIEKQAKFFEEEKKKAIDLLSPKMLPPRTLALNEAISYINKQQEKFKTCLENLGSIFFNPLENTITPYSEAKHVPFLRNKNVYMGFNLNKVKYSAFYKNRNKSFSLEKENRIIGHNCKFLVNDSKENITKIEKLIKYQTNSPEFKGFEYVVIIHNNTLPELQSLIQYLNPQKFSELTIQYSATPPKTTAGSHPTFKETTLSARTVFNCLKKEFLSKYNASLKKVLNDGEMFSDKEYLILSWEDKDFMKEIHDLVSCIKEYVPVYFVAPKDLSLFKDKKFFKKENFHELKVMKQLKSDLAKLMTIKKEMVAKKKYGIVDVLANLSVLSVASANKFDLNYDFKGNFSLITKLAAKYKVKPDLTFAKKINKVFQNPYTDYVMFYLSENYLSYKEVLKVRSDLGL